MNILYNDSIFILLWIRSELAETNATRMWRMLLVSCFRSTSGSVLPASCWLWGVDALQLHRVHSVITWQWSEILSELFDCVDYFLTERRYFSHFIWFSYKVIEAWRRSPTCSFLRATEILPSSPPPGRKVNSIIILFTLTLSTTLSTSAAGITLIY